MFWVLVQEGQHLRRGHRQAGAETFTWTQTCCLSNTSLSDVDCHKAALFMLAYLLVAGRAEHYLTTHVCVELSST
jgi:hypothetical protein